MGGFLGDFGGLVDEVGDVGLGVLVADFLAVGCDVGDLEESFVLGGGDSLGCDCQAEGLDDVVAVFVDEGPVAGAVPEADSGDRYAWELGEELVELFLLALGQGLGQ